MRKVAGHLQSLLHLVHCCRSYTMVFIQRLGGRCATSQVQCLSRLWATPWKCIVTTCSCSRPGHVSSAHMLPCTCGCAVSKYMQLGSGALAPDIVAAVDLAEQAVVFLQPSQHLLSCLHFRLQPARMMLTVVLLLFLIACCRRLGQEIWQCVQMVLGSSARHLCQRCAGCHAVHTWQSSTLWRIAVCLAEV